MREHVVDVPGDPGAFLQSGGAGLFPAVSGAEISGVVSRN